MGKVEDLLGDQGDAELVGKVVAIAPHLPKVNSLCTVVGQVCKVHLFIHISSFIGVECRLIRARIPFTAPDYFKLNVATTNSSLTHRKPTMEST